MIVEYGRGEPIQHMRPGYTMIEAVHTAEWLNDRAENYPRNENIQFNSYSR